MTGKVLGIYIATHNSEAMRSIDNAELEAGRGIIGDRYHSNSGTFSEKLKDLPDHELTLIESEEIDKFNQEQDLTLSYGDMRRNIITKDIRLNDLEGKEFEIGSIKCKGIRLCEPCSHLAKLVSSKVLPNMVGRSGLRAAILSSGNIKEEDEIKLVS